METIQNPEPRLEPSSTGGLLSFVALCLSLSFHPQETYSFKTPLHQLGDTEVSSVLPPPPLCDSLNFFAPASPIARKTSTHSTLMRIVEGKDALQRYKKKTKTAIGDCAHH